MDGGSIPPISTNRCHVNGLESLGNTRFSSPFLWSWSLTQDLIAHKLSAHKRRKLRLDAVVMPTEGFAVSYENIPDHHIPAADEPSVPELEADETIPPRPEEEIADELRAEPDL